MNNLAVDTKYTMGCSERERQRIGNAFSFSVSCFSSLLFKEGTQGKALKYAFHAH